MSDIIFDTYLESGTAIKEISYIYFEREPAQAATGSLISYLVTPSSIYNIFEISMTHTANVPSGS